jgi:SAM-dependent methyltransferase
VVDLLPLRADVLGYRTTRPNRGAALPAPVESAYAHDQLLTNPAKVASYLVPIIERLGAERVADIGCGVGAMVTELVARGIDAYGVDLATLAPNWDGLGQSRDRFFVVWPDEFELPFADGSVDLAFSIGVIEHIGTSDSNVTLRADYREVRRAWLTEVFRTVRVGGHLLVGCPNRMFPVDVAHGWNPNARRWEEWLSTRAGAMVHKPWGEHFLASYRDITSAFRDLPCTVIPMSVAGLLNYSRVPRFVRPVVRTYLERLPQRLLGTAMNPWTMALIRKDAPS